MRPSPEGGYASVSAIILCAALSLLCAGVLGLVMAQKKMAQRDFLRAQQTEAVNTALMELGVLIAAQQGDATISKATSVQVPEGTMTVTVRAEYEGRKWPQKRLVDVEDAVLSAYVPEDLSKRWRSSESEGKTASTSDDALLDDCARSLFSPYGQADVKKPLPKGVGLIAMSAGHDGQVWRLRAVLGNRLEERRVRFLGDPKHIFAVVSQSDYALGEMPTCTQLKEMP